MTYTWVCDECREEIKNKEPYVDVKRLINSKCHVEGVKVHKVFRRCLEKTEAN